MKRIKSISSLLTVISLFFGVIWLSPAFAAMPTFTSLGQITAEALQAPGAMDMDADGNLYVADARGGEVFKFDPYGKLVQSFDVAGSGRGLAVTPDGQRLYVSRDESLVVVDAVSGDVLGSLSGSEVDGPEFMTAGEVDLDADGNLFVVDSGRMVVKVFDVTGQYRNRFGAPGPNPGQFMQIGGMTVNPAGQIVVTDASVGNARVHVFSVDAGFDVVGVVAFANASFGAPLMFSPAGVAFDDQGRAYFLESMRAQLRVANASFGYLGAFGSPGYAVGQLSNLTDAIFDTRNSRIFVGCDTRRIEIFGVDGGSNPQPVNQPPATPQPQSPVAGSVVLSATPALKFGNVLDPDGDSLTYNVVVKQGESVVFEKSAPADAGDVTVVAVDSVDGLADNEGFTWTVQAFDGKALSGVSAPTSFYVNSVEQTPSVPTPSAAFAGGSIDGSAVFSWSESVDPDPRDTVSYRIELSSNAAFDSGVVNELLPGTSMVLEDFAAFGDLLEGGTYFWRVIALDSDGDESLPSSVDSFVYDTTSLTITANMPDAKISFHGNHAYAGRFEGVAPLVLSDFAPGTMSVVVERAGFEPFVAQVTLDEGDNVELYAELVPAMVVSKLSESRNGINGRSGLTVAGSAAPFLVDFDNDGDLDLLVGDGSLTLYKNMQMAGRNRLNFDEGVDLGVTGSVPFVADWNNDGKKDLIVGQANGLVKLYVNTGSEDAPAFGVGEDLILPQGLDAAPAVVDYDGDGDKDLLVGDNSGQINVYWNKGSDSEPVLDGSKQLVLSLGDAVVPFPVDWDADGQKEILVSAGGVVTVYKKIDGAYQADIQFDERRNGYFAAFPIDLDGSGKQLLVGQADGELVYLTGNSTEPVAAFHLALLDKAAELAGLVDSTLAAEVSTVASLIEAGDYVAAATVVQSLVAVLPEGEAKTSALQLLDLLQY